MTTIKKTPLDILDDIYSLAYWMTGNESVSQELVKKTYSNARTNTKETELLKRFRNCYVDLFGQHADFCLTEKNCHLPLQLIDSVKQWAADIKLSVLLSEISGLQHQQISEIVEKPMDTLRIWLLWGRKLFVNNSMLKASA